MIRISDSDNFHEENNTALRCVCAGSHNPHDVVMAKSCNVELSPETALRCQWVLGAPVHLLYGHRHTMRHRRLPCTTYGSRGLFGPGICTRLIRNCGGVGLGLRCQGGRETRGLGRHHPPSDMPKVELRHVARFRDPSSYTEFHFHFISIQKHHVTARKMFLKSL
uniref:Uncharacterized protein n=1 Tax=Rousettus aegyptiacus TaxID=9407 RepID=A0A7J8C2C6_ROUAE|nr:hypothetical protein HJG63_009338 [Rousettus aegyptiacus]